jgi:hypothetical protein
MQEYRIVRSGDRPLVFSGELLKSVETPDLSTSDKARSRKFVMALYRTESGKLVAELRYSSAFPSEPPVADAEVFDNPNADAITDWYNEAAGMTDDGPGIVRGPHPGTPNWEKRTREIKAAMSLEFDRCLGVILDLPMFEERV